MQHGQSWWCCRGQREKREGGVETFIASSNALHKAKFPYFPKPVFQLSVTTLNPYSPLLRWNPLHQSNSKCNIIYTNQLVLVIAPESLINKFTTIVRRREASMSKELEDQSSLSPALLHSTGPGLLGFCWLFPALSKILVGGGSIHDCFVMLAL